MKIPEILLIRSQHKPGSLSRILGVIGEAGLVVEGLRQVRRDYMSTTWEITIEPDDPRETDEVLAAIDALPNAKVLGRSDRVFDRHRGGKIEMKSRMAISSLERLRDLYTPGVARVCLAIHEDPALARAYTGLANSVAVVTNGTAILGLGDIGPVAGMPVMEGKAALFAELAGISAVPILINEKDPKKLVEIIAAIAPSFGAIQLEDIRAPECFEVEEALIERLDRPVMHDDQHGTAIVVLAALLGATRRAGIALSESVVGQIGLGAAGLGICDLLIKYGVKGMLGSDLNEAAKQRLATMGGRPTDLAGVMAGADVVVATTGVKGLIKPSMVRPGQVILALSNPEPEIEPEKALAAGARFATDGKVVNNVLGFPGVFRGALDANARRITDAMLIAAAETLANLSQGDALVPDPLDREVHKHVASAVKESALGLVLGDAGI
ncbi:MAG: NAD-dependent malic enzyme [Myxococcales bacterium]|nr:NAD-dependent malic enzyme [Myxococcales bacterium]